VDPSATDIDHSSNPINKEDVIALLLSGMGANDHKYFDKDIFDSIDKGIDHEWDRPAKVSGKIRLSENTQYLMPGPVQLYLSIFFHQISDCRKNLATKTCPR
jgi:hypothetical protein